MVGRVLKKGRRNQMRQWFITVTIPVWRWRRVALRPGHDRELVWWRARRHRPPCSWESSIQARSMVIPQTATYNHGPLASIRRREQLNDLTASISILDHQASLLLTLLALLNKEHDSGGNKEIKHLLNSFEQMFNYSIALLLFKFFRTFCSPFPTDPRVMICCPLPLNEFPVWISWI